MNVTDVIVLRYNREDVGTYGDAWGRVERKKLYRVTVVITERERSNMPQGNANS